MTKPPRLNLLGRPPKRARSEAEIEAAAEGFRTDWVPGDYVQTWLNRREGRRGELSEMIEDGWSWNDIARAMFKAGIHYRTGQPIPAATLCTKAWEARLRYETSAVAPPPQAAAVAPAQVKGRTRATVPEADPAASMSDAADLDFEIKPVTLRNWSGPKPEAGPPFVAQPPLNPLPKEPVDVDAVIARLLGKPLPPEDE
jgi:hypothetical protein